MKQLFLGMMALLLVIPLSGCGRADEINASSSRTAYRSVKMIKNRLPMEKRIEFEVSFWTIRDTYKNTDAFLDEVGGKNPEEIIAKGREIYQERKNAGFKDYDKYQSWDDMIAQFSEERLAQDRNVKSDPREQKNSQNVDYRMRSM
ncbi:MAG: hypothetical protein RQ715_08350 [Methylococcales bacterium]|nr:hypothetical protein [Methylococcales bacterium]